MDALKLSVQQLLLLMGGNPARGRLGRKAGEKMVLKFRKCLFCVAAKELERAFSIFTIFYF